MRIISGKFKGKKLFIDNKCNFRPTTDRNREMIFNMIDNFSKISFDISKAKILGVAKYEYLPKNGVWEKSKKHLSCKMMNCLEEIHLPCCWSTPFQLQNRFSKTWRHVIKAKALFKLGLSSFVNGSSMIYNIPGPGQTFFLIWKTIFGEAMVCWND